MKPAPFPQANRNLVAPAGKTKDEVGDLPVFSDGIYCVSLWQMSWRDRLSALFHGRVWLWVMSGNTQPPVSMVVEKDVFDQKGKG